ncbi:MAG: DMT family transporter [Treponema sp.]|jgi:drug/metabolite transporter (DMT)-like permease|nr:DMT family transporter [Treponema sp.]
MNRNNKVFRSERFKALLAVISCVLFWGFSFVSIKIAIGFFGPMTLGAIRFAIALVLLFFIKRRLGPREKIRARDLPLFAGAGLTGVTFYFFCENNGVSLVTASEASIIIAAIPVITMIAEWAGSRIRGGKEEKPPLTFAILRWAGAAISMIGVVLVARVSFTVSGSGLGYIFMAGACVSWVAYCFLTRPLFCRYSRICIVFWQSLFGFLGFLPFAFFEPLKGLTLSPLVWGHIAFLGICCSALGYWFYAWSLETLGVEVSSVFINFIPVVTAAAGFFILGERLAPLQLAGAALVLAGVYLAMAEPKQT